jgi:hypothetical protein
LRGKPSHGCCFAEASFRISWAPRAAWCATAGGACRDAVLFLFFEMDDRSLLPVLIFNGICPPHYS